MPCDGGEEAAAARRECGAQQVPQRVEDVQTVQTHLAAAPTPPAHPGCSTARALYRHKAVRDLHWVMASPHLLDAHVDGVSVVQDDWCAALVANATSWLDALDAHPAPLLQFLRSQRNVQRLGFYFAALLEFWVRACPALVADGLGNPQTPQVLTQQQIHIRAEGTVAGQLKCVFRHCFHSRARIAADAA